MQNAPREHSAILLTCIKLPPVFKTFILPIFEWLLKTGLTVYILLQTSAVKNHKQTVFDQSRYNNGLYNNSSSYNHGVAYPSYYSQTRASDAVSMSGGTATASVKNQQSMSLCHYDNIPMQYTAIFHGCKYDNFQTKKI